MRKFLHMTLNLQTTLRAWEKLLNVALKTTVWHSHPYASFGHCNHSSFADIRLIWKCVGEVSPVQSSHEPDPLHIIAQEATWTKPRSPHLSPFMGFQGYSCPQLPCRRRHATFAMLYSQMGSEMALNEPNRELPCLCWAYHLFAGLEVTRGI